MFYESEHWLQAASDAWTVMRATAQQDPSGLRDVLVAANVAEVQSSTLARFLEDTLERLEMIHEPPAPHVMDDRSADAGMLWLDDLGAAVLEDVGPTGRQLAKELRAAAQRRWLTRTAPSTDLWCQWRRFGTSPAPPFVLAASRALADMPVVPRLRSERLPLMLAWPVASALLDALGPKGRAPLRESIDAHRIVRWLISRAQSTPRTNGRAEWLCDSWRAVSNDIGGSDRTRKKLPSIVHALERLAIPGSAGPLRVIDAFEILAEGHVGFRAGEGLYVRAVHQFRSHAQRMAPVLPLPCLIGNRTSFPGQAALQMAFVLELRNRARELAEEGGVHMDAAAWQRLALRVGLAARLVPGVVASWLETHNGPPELRLVGLERYALAHRHAAAIDVLLAGADRDRSASTS